MSLLLAAAPAASALAICGNGVIDPGEQCDDGDTLGFDGCSNSCMSEYALALQGAAQGGSISVTIAGATVVVPTVAGQSDYEVAQLIAAAITADPTLVGLGIEAQALGGLLYVNGVATDLVSADPGLLLSDGTPVRNCTEIASEVAATSLSGISVSDAWDGIVVSAQSSVYRRDPETLAGVGASTVFLHGIVAMTEPVQLQSGTRAVYLSSDGAYLYMMNATTGNFVWAVNLSSGTCSGDSVVAEPIFHANATATPAFKIIYPGQDLVYFGTAYGCDYVNNRVYALEASTGSIKWTFNGGSTSDVDRIMGMVLDEASDVLYLATDRRESTSQSSVWALDVLTGTVLWSTSVAMHWAAPVLANGRIYVGSTQGELTALDAADGSIQWTLPNGTGIPFASNLVDATFVPGNTRVALVDYIGNLRVARDDGTSGSWEWTTPVPSPHNGWLAFDSGDGSLYTGGADGKLYAFDVATGALIGARTVDNDAASIDRIAVRRPSAASGNEAWILTGSADGTLAKLCTGAVAGSTPMVPALGATGRGMLVLAFAGVAWWRQRRPFRRRDPNRSGL